MATQPAHPLEGSTCPNIAAQRARKLEGGARLNMAAQPAHQQTPNRWRGPIGSLGNPGDEQEDENFREEMQNQVIEDGFANIDALPSVNSTLIRKFLGK